MSYYEVKIVGNPGGNYQERVKDLLENGYIEFAIRIVDGTEEFAKQRARIGTRLDLLEQGRELHSIRVYPMIGNTPYAYISVVVTQASKLMYFFRVYICNTPADDGQAKDDAIAAARAPGII